jgi:hypothetical protein
LFIAAGIRINRVRRLLRGHPFSWLAPPGAHIIRHLMRGSKMSHYTVVPPETQFQDSESNSDLPKVSLDSIVFLFQVLMALAITNGAYVFVTNGSGNYILRPWSSYTLYQTVAFLTFMVTLIPFAHANVIILKQSYGNGFKGAGLKPLIDFFLLFLEAGLFYTWSHALARVDQDPMSFFYIGGAILCVDVFWVLITVGFDQNRRETLVYALLNSVAIVLGAALIWWNAPYFREVVLLILAIRTVLDFSLTYNLLFPDAFRSASQPSQMRGHDAGLIRNLSALAMFLIGISAFLPGNEPLICGQNCGVLEGFLIPLLFIGLLVAAIAWVLGLIRAASVRQWVWLVAIGLFTILAPLTAAGISMSVSPLGNSWLYILRAFLLLLTPLMLLIYGIAESAR